MNPQVSLPGRPWQALDPGVSGAISPVLGAVADEITEAIAEAIPEYRQPMGGAFGRGVRDAIEETLRQFLEQLGRPAAGERPGREVYIALGRGEYRAGRGLDALQGAYRVGARIAWRRISEAAIAAGLDSTTLALLAESIFAYIDEVSAESVEGYASEQAASAGGLGGGVELHVFRHPGKLARLRDDFLAWVKPDLQHGHRRSGYRMFHKRYLLLGAAFLALTFADCP